MIYSKQARLNEACSPVLRQSATSGARGHSNKTLDVTNAAHHSTQKLFTPVAAKIGIEVEI